jgi:hypothetical protein
MNRIGIVPIAMAIAVIDDGAFAIEHLTIEP